MIVRRYGMARWVRLVAIAVVLVVMLFPVYWMFITAITPTKELLQYPVPLFPASVDWSAFNRVLFEQSLLEWLKNSAFLTIASTIITLLVSVPAAYGLSRFKSKASSATGFLLLLTKMIPSTLFLIPLYVIFQGVGLVDTLASLVIAYTVFGVPFATWMLMGYFDSIPPQLEEAAQVDGCGQFGAFMRVTLPLAAPGVAATVLASAVLAWSDYDFARGLITSSSKWPVTVGIQSFFGEHVVHWNDVMASSLLSVLPVAVLFMFVGKYMIAGLTSGAVK